MRINTHLPTESECSINIYKHTTAGLKWQKHSELEFLVSSNWYSLTIQGSKKHTCQTGDQDEGGVDYFGFKYGVEVFDLTTDQICNLLENTDVNKCKFQHYTKSNLWLQCNCVFLPHSCPNYPFHCISSSSDDIYGIRRW